MVHAVIGVLNVEHTAPLRSDRGSHNGLKDAPEIYTKINHLYSAWAAVDCSAVGRRRLLKYSKKKATTQPLSHPLSSPLRS